MSERWLPVPGMEGRYEVSDLGNVRSLVTNHGAPWPDGPRLVSQHGVGYRREYLKVNLWQGGQRVAWRVHRLVLLAFVGAPPDPSYEVLHGERGSRCNELDNLKWGTKAENNAAGERAPAGTYTGSAFYDVMMGTMPLQLDEAG